MIQGHILETGCPNHCQKYKKTPSFTLDNWRLRDERFKLLPGNF